MSTQVSIFQGNATSPSVFASIFGGVQTIDRQYQERFPRLSFRGGKFHGTLNGETTTFMDEEGVPANRLDVVIVGIPAGRSQVMFPKYDDSKPAAPLCSSINGRTPDKDVKEPFSASCSTCEKRVKIRQEDGKERSPCQQTVNLAVIVNGHGDTVWALKLPITSVYNKESENSDYRAWDQHVAFLRQNGISHPAQTTTRLTFSSQDQFPRLGFKAVKHLSDEELMAIAPIIQSQIVKDITLGTTEQIGDGSQQPVRAIVQSEAPKQLKDTSAEEAAIKAENEAVAKAATEAKIRAEIAAKLAEQEAKAREAEKAKAPTAEQLAAEATVKMEAEIRAKVMAEMAAAQTTKAEKPVKEKKEPAKKIVTIEPNAELDAALDW